jgi:MoaA/NifB/PqqE/SkfB family radical SAM enzyme
MIFEVDPNHNYNLDGLKTHVCMYPYMQFQVYSDFDVEVCCRSWMKNKVIGNLATQTAEEIINSPVLKDIIEDMEAGNWSYCTDVCPLAVRFLKSRPENGGNGDLKFTVITPKERTDSVVDNSLRERLRYKDYVIFFNHDQSCNLQCPSCRNEFIHISSKKNPEKYNILYKVQKEIERMIELLMLREDASTVCANITGSGDPFASELYWNYLLELNEKVLLPEYSKLRVKLQTNGMLMTPERMDKIKNLWPRINWISISIDAATQETYSIVRKRGNLEAVQKNVKWLNEKVEAREIGEPESIDLCPWCVNFIVQTDNYKEMAEFTKLYTSYNSIHNVWLNPIDDWGHLDMAEAGLFNRKAVWRKEHPEYNNFIEILKDPIFDHPKANIGSLATFRSKS